MRPAVYMCGLVFVSAWASFADETTPAFRDVESEELSEKLGVADDSLGGVTNKTLLKRIDQLEKRIAELESRLTRLNGWPTGGTAQPTIVHAMPAAAPPNTSYRSATPYQ